MELNEAKAKLFDAIGSINNKEIRAITQRVADNIAEYFYIVPSSSSGKYHPTDELEQGGLVLHTLKCVKVAEVMSRMWQLSDYEKDLAVAALILHDSCKNGTNFDCGHTAFLHPAYAAEFVTINNAKSIVGNKANKIAKQIAKLIKSHMGQWNTNQYEPGVKLPLPKTKLEKFVHECDYIASRKEFTIHIY